MSDNYSLIIKNGSCYINGELVKTDLGLYGKKIKKEKDTTEEIKLESLEKDNEKIGRAHV